MATSKLASAYEVLGLSANATKQQVKDAFRQLSKVHHPDLCRPEHRASAEVTYKNITAAYEALLKREAGYAPPPPGMPPNPMYARAYSEAHGETTGRAYGPYAGHNTEWEYYSAWFHGSSKNSSVLLSMAGLLGIPIVAFGVSATRGQSETMQRMRKDGLDAFKATWEVNGKQTPINPYAPQHENDSYVFKHERYAHLREPKRWTVPGRPEAGAAPAPAGASAAQAGS